jgi:hypothetical protein
MNLDSDSDYDVKYDPEEYYVNIDDDYNKYTQYIDDYSEDYSDTYSDTDSDKSYEYESPKKLVGEQFFAPETLDILINTASIDELLSYYQTSKIFKNYLNRSESIEILSKRFNLNPALIKTNIKISPFIWLVSVYDKEYVRRRCGILSRLECIIKTIIHNSEKLFFKLLPQFDKNEDLYTILEALVKYDRIILAKYFFNIIKDKLENLNNYILNEDKSKLLTELALQNNSLSMFRLLEKQIPIDWDYFETFDYSHLPSDMIHEILEFKFKSEYDINDLLAALKIGNDKLINKIIKNLNVGRINNKALIKLLNFASNNNNENIIDKILSLLKLSENKIFTLIKAAVKTPEITDEFFKIFCYRYPDMMINLIYNIVIADRTFRNGDDDIIAKLGNCLYFDENMSYIIELWLRRNKDNISDKNWTIITSFI